MAAPEPPRRSSSSHGGTRPKLSLGLSAFFKSENIPILSASAPPLSPSGSTNGVISSNGLFPLAQCSIEEHNRRSFSSALHSQQLWDALKAHSTTPPLTPRDSFLSLYPPPPHLTPQASPSHSPPLRAQVLPPAADVDNLPTTHLIGKLTIRVVEARGLSCAPEASPYVLLQYDRTDSVSREFGAPPPAKKAKVGVKRIGASAIARGSAKPILRQTHSSNTVQQGATTVRRVGEGRERAADDAAKDVPSPVPPAQVEGTPAAPIWNHSAQFDVVQPGRTILLCVYDKHAPISEYSLGFKGACVFEAPLSHEMGADSQGLDIWIPLKSEADPSMGGEVRLRILFETLQSRPKLSVEDFQVLKLIGQGSFGQVFRVRKRDTKRIYAMKCIQKAGVTSRSALAQVLAERQVLARTLDSPFLVGLKFSFQSPTDLFLVIDYKSGGELFTHLQKDGGRFEESKVRFYVSEIVLALEYLHKAGIIYRDLKPENCLLDGSGHCVLVDFGLSKLLQSPEDSTRTLCGTTAFMAPEILLDIGYNYRCDWWSLGCLLFEMCYGWSPFYAESRVEEYERILSGEIKIPAKKGYSAENKDLLLQLLTREPNDRIGAHGGASEIKAHPFFSRVDWRKVALRQVTPPYMPPAVADDDDYTGQGRTAEWMFSGKGCEGCDDEGRLDEEGLWRDFSFSAKPKPAKEGPGGEEVVPSLSSSPRMGGRRSSWNGNMP